MLKQGKPQANVHKSVIPCPFSFLEIFNKLWRRPGPEQDPGTQQQQGVASALSNLTNGRCTVGGKRHQRASGLGSLFGLAWNQVRETNISFIFRNISLIFEWEFTTVFTFWEYHHVPEDSGDSCGLTGLCVERGCYTQESTDPGCRDVLTVYLGKES